MLLLTSVAQAQTAPNIAVLSSYDTPASTILLDGFRSYLEQQGIKADLAIHSLENSQEKSSPVLAQLQETKPDLVLALGSLALKSAGEQLTEIPVIASMVINKADFEKHKNVTGVALGAHPLVAAGVGAEGVDQGLLAQLLAGGGMVVFPGPVDRLHEVLDHVCSTQVPGTPVRGPASYELSELRL